MNTSDWRSINDLFHAALARSAVARRAFLGAQCGGNEEVAAAVERLLRAHENAQGFLHEPAAAGALRVLTASDAAPAGSLIGPYRIVCELGRGGMGAVYLADRADEQFRKQVAIKLIKRGRSTLGRRFDAANGLDSRREPAVAPTLMRGRRVLSFGLAARPGGGLPTRGVRDDL